jgi:hypothetical protein
MLSFPDLYLFHFFFCLLPPAMESRFYFVCALHPAMKCSVSFSIFLKDGVAT